MICTVFGARKDTLYSLLENFGSGHFGLVKDGGRHRADGILLESGKTAAKKYLVVPGRNVRYFSRFGAKCVISCGMSVRDSISASSVTEDAVTLSVHRGFAAVSGELIEIQEIPLQKSSQAGTECVIMAAAALLAAGCAQEELCDAVF